jgi:hypothetical protein
MGVLVEKEEIWRPICRCEDNIQMNFIEIESGGVDGIHLAQDRDQLWDLVNTVMKLRFPYDSGKFLSRRATGGFSRTRLHGVSLVSSFGVVCW